MSETKSILDERPPKVGDPVVFHDPTGAPHNALITTVWQNGMVNLVFVSSDETRQDSYGRQIERATSLHHKSNHPVFGFYWRFPEEEATPRSAPVES